MMNGVLPKINPTILVVVPHIPPMLIHLTKSCLPNPANRNKLQTTHPHHVPNTAILQHLNARLMIVLMHPTLPPATMMEICLHHVYKDSVSCEIEIIPLGYI